MNHKYYPIRSIVIAPVVLIIFLIFQNITFAQANSGSLQGTVKDSTTAEQLFGTTVWLENTSQGIATGIEGEYKITQIEPGTYNVVFRYIGYEQKKISVTIKRGQTLNLDVTLVAKAIQGREVVVTAQARGQQQAINQQLSSSTIVNIVSSDKIRQLPDDNAATALSRLPGVSLMNGDQVVIRGVEAKLNQVMVNGIQMPSTNMDNRATNLGFISSNMLAGIEVIKAITPDMDANTIGGVVNLKLREAPSGLHSDVLAQGNYNYSDRTAENYKVWASISNRFFDDNLGVFLQANADRTDAGNQSARINIGIDASGILKYGEAVYKTNSAGMEYDQNIVNTNGFSLIMDYKLPNGKIVLQNTYAGNTTDQRNNINNLDFVNTQFQTTVDRNKYGKDMWINAIQAENTFGDVKLEASLSHAFTDQYTKVAYQSGTWTDFHNNTKSQFPFGTDPISKKPITYTSGTEQRNMPLSRAYSIFDNINPADRDSSTLEGWPSAIFNTFKQHLYNAAADVTIPINFSGDITATIKAGGKYSRTTRERDFDRNFSGASDDDTYSAVSKYFPGRPRSGSNRLRLNDVLNSDFSRGKNFLSDEYSFKNGFVNVIDPEIYDSWLMTSMSGWTPAMKMDDSWKDDYNGAEAYTAGYLMGTFNIMQNFTLLGGVRYESYNMKYRANFTYVIHSVYGNAVSTATGSAPNIPDSVYNVDRTDENFFPSVQLKFKPNEWSDIRVAYTSGIARPDYLSIVPKIAVFPKDHMEVGNPNLKPTTAQNIDLIVSLYSNKIGLFTIDGFYKELKDVQYDASIYYGNLSMYAGGVFVPDSTFLTNRFQYAPLKNDQIRTTLNSPNKGYIRGFEVDWQTNFWYLPEPFNSLVLSVNYTKSWSNMDYRIIRNNPTTVFNPITHRSTTVFVTTDTVYTGRLLQQAGDVLNAAIGIDYGGFSGRLSFNMRGNVTNNIGIRPEETSYTGNIYRWDFTLKQNLPIEGLSVQFNGVNIFHNGIKSYRQFRMTADAPVTENLVSVLYGPTVYQLNLRYAF